MLKNSKKRSINPKFLINTLKNFDGTKIDVREQKDVDEFLISFIDTLEQQLKLIGKEKLLERIFMGDLFQEIVGIECNHISTRIEKFLVVTLHIKQMRNINNSLNNFVRWETLEKDNAYFCEQCDKKIRAQKRTSFNTLPNILIISLKRFEFDIKTLAKKKLNDYFEFPEELKILNYTKEKLHKKPLKMSTYYSYKLRGITIHKGRADYGHYFSLIKKENKWFEFNDDNISPFDIKSLKKVAFGGDSLHSQNKSAYILFYERVEYFNENNNVIQNLQEGFEVNYNTNIDDIKNDLMKNEYYDFVAAFLGNKKFSEFMMDFKNVNYSQLQVVLKYFLIYYVRDFNQEKFDKFFDRIIKSITDNLEICLYLLENLSPSIIFEFLVNNPKTKMRKIILILIRVAVKCVFNNYFYVNEDQKENIFYKFFENCFYCAHNGILINLDVDQVLAIISDYCDNDEFFCKRLKNLGFEEFFEKYMTSSYIQKKNIEEQTSDFDKKEVFLEPKVIDKKQESNSMAMDRTEILNNQGGSNSFNNLLHLFLVYTENLNEPKEKFKNFFDQESIYTTVSKLDSKKTLKLFYRYICDIYKENSMSLISIISDIPVNLKNFFKYFLFLKEIVDLKKLEFNDKVLYFLHSLITDNSYHKNYHFFNYYVHFLGELCVLDGKFLKLLKTDEILIEGLYNKNEETETFEDVQENVF